MFICKEDAKFLKRYAMEGAEAYMQLFKNLKECTNYIYDSENDKTSDRNDGLKFGIQFCQTFISQYLNIAETFKDEKDIEISKSSADVMLNFIRETSREDIKMFDKQKAGLLDEGLSEIVLKGADIDQEDQTFEDFMKELERIILVLTFGSEKVA